MDRNTQIITIFIFIISLVLIGGSFWYLDKTNLEAPEGNLLSLQQASEKAINYINQNILGDGVTASLLNAVEEGGVYKIQLKIADGEYSSYITKDGKYLFPEGYDLTIQPQSLEETLQEEITQTIPEREKPDVKLFVMSYCPFGLQAQKMFLSVYNLFQDKADMGVYFVNYIMHEKKEIDENLNQYCIQKEEKEKFYDYLNCFVKDGDTKGCLEEAKIDRVKLEDCIVKTDKEYNVYSQYEDRTAWLNGRFPKFDVHSTLNEKYGIGGSPTLVINDKEVEINSRSPEKFKEVLCQSFVSQPPECSQTLSDTAFSSGFGLEAGDNPSGGGCVQ